MPMPENLKKAERVFGYCVGHLIKPLVDENDDRQILHRKLCTYAPLRVKILKIYRKGNDIEVMVSCPFRHFNNPTFCDVDEVDRGMGNAFGVNYRRTRRFTGDNPTCTFTYSRE